jgi:hypothetical protein
MDEVPGTMTLILSNYRTAAFAPGWLAPWEARVYASTRSTGSA